MYSKLHAFVENTKYFECTSTDRHVNIFHTMNLVTLSEPQEGSEGFVHTPQRSNTPVLPTRKLELGKPFGWEVNVVMSSRNSYKSTYLLN